MDNVKDFILNNDGTAADNKAVSKRPVTYEVVFATGPDFAVRRKTAKTSQVLVIIISQGQFYIKNETAGGTIENLTVENYGRFLADSDDVLSLEAPDGSFPNWISRLEKEKKMRDRFLFYIRNTDFHPLMRQNMFFVNQYGASSRPYSMETKELKTLFDHICQYVDREDAKCALSKSDFAPVNVNDYAKTASLFEGLFSTSSSGYRAEPRIRTYDILMSKWGISGLKQLITAYYEAPLTSFPENIYMESVFTRHTKRATVYSLQNVDTLAMQTNFDLQSFVDYLCNSSCEQGFADNVNSFLSSWSDYLDIQLQYYGKIVDKYSDNLLSDERKLSFQLAREQSITHEEEFQKVAETLAPFCMKGEHYMITVPKDTKELIEEGRKMSNCIASYVDRVADHECMIFFCRKTSDPDTSFVDIEIRGNDFSLGQVKARFNREPDVEARAFIERWYSRKFKAAALAELAS